MVYKINLLIEVSKEFFKFLLALNCYLIIIIKTVLLRFSIQTVKQSGLV